MADEKRFAISDKKLEKLKKINESTYQGIVDAVLSRKEEILALDMYDLEKLSQLFPKAIALNGCCTG
jgi:hypothetical protein